MIRHVSFGAVSFGAVSLVSLALAACSATNPPSVKSENGTDVTPVVGAKAVKEEAKLPAVTGGPALGKRSPKLEAVAVFDGPAQAVGIAVSKQGRIFLSFPRWGDPVQDTLVELNGTRLQEFPDRQTNFFDATKPKEFDPAQHLVSVQAIVFDERDRLWVLDPGGLDFNPPLLHAPKLWAYDINTRQRVKAISFPIDVALKTTSLNDVRIDLRRGPEGTAYITDSGVGGIIVVDLASGSSWRHLDSDPTVLPTPGLEAMSEGKPFLRRTKLNEIDAPDFRSDGIALSPDGKTLYYTAVMSHEIYSVPTDLLADRNADEKQISAAVKTVATKPSGNDGMLCDAEGRIYSTDFEDNAIRRVTPGETAAAGRVEVVAQDERFIWPDTLALHGHDLYVTVDQLARQPNYHFGKDERHPPYVLYKLAIDGTGKP